MTGIDFSYVQEVAAAVPARVLTLEDGSLLPVARLHSRDDLSGVLHELGLEGDRPTLVLIGGAGGMDAAALHRIEPIVSAGLVPAIIELGAAIVDGGTDSGVMRLIGGARKAAGATFPLVAVVAEGTVALPDGSTSDGDRMMLEQRHSHVVLVPGSRWGDESPWIARIATFLAGAAPSATFLVNGGDIALEDARQSLVAQRPLLVVAGSGRSADRLAAAREGAADDDVVTRLAASPLLSVIPGGAGAHSVGEALVSVLRPAR